MTNFEVLKKFQFQIINNQAIKNSLLNIIKYHYTYGTAIVLSFHHNTIFHKSLIQALNF